MTTKGVRLLAIGALMMLVGVLTAWRVQTDGGVRVSDVRFPGANGVRMSALLYRPQNATARTPAPGVLAVHGYINSRETQSGFAIELARRGYVVLALDQTGHGYSGGAAFSNGFGGPDGLRYLRGLPFVDGANIGLEGHSMGGWTVLAAAAAAPNDYKAVVLEGSSTGAPFAAPGTPAWPRNLAVVFSHYDEFSRLMWGTARAQDAPTSPKLQAQFGVKTEVEPGRLYGAIQDGTARVLFQPSTTHPGDHISTEAIGRSLDWFGRTLRGGRIVADQIWPWKEAATLLALIGWAVFVLGAAEALLASPPFAVLQGSAQALGGVRDRRWWTTLALTAVVPVLLLFPAFALAGLALKPSALFRQAITNQVMLWALASAAATLALSALRKLRSPRADQAWVPAALFALAVSIVAYLPVWLASFVPVDFRFWVVALKPLSARQAIVSLAYIVPFAVFFAVTLRALSTGLAVKGERAARAYGAAVLALCGGFAVFLGVDYALLFATGRLPTDFDPLTTIVAMQFVPLLAFVAVLATFLHRRTGRYAPGALLCALLVTWYMVAGTATHV